MIKFKSRMSLFEMSSSYLSIMTNKKTQKYILLNCQVINKTTRIEMVKIRLNACCFCISLRRGCIGIAFFDVIVNLLIILLGPQELISQPERAVCICHCIGCVMLLLGALIQSTVLLVFYLITSFVNTAILIICFIIQTVSNLSLRPYVLIFVVVLTAINVYFYIIAYSYYQQVNTPFEEDDEA